MWLPHLLRLSTIFKKLLRQCVWRLYLPRCCFHYDNNVFLMMAVCSVSTRLKWHIMFGYFCVCMCSCPCMGMCVSLCGRECVWSVCIRKSVYVHEHVSVCFSMFVFAYERMWRGACVCMSDCVWVFAYVRLSIRLLYVCVCVCVRVFSQPLCHK